MTEKDFNYIAFDAQYILHRNFEALKSRTRMDMVASLTEDEGDSTVGYVISKYDFSAHDLVKQFFWSIVKMTRDSFSCNKILLLWDKSPYHKQTLLPDYKGTRHYTSQEKLDEWDILEDPEGYLQEKENHRADRLKSEAKYWIIDFLDEFGMVSVMHRGYEADDLAYIFSHLPEILDSELPSAICSADNDWYYWISPNTKWISFNAKQAWGYQDAIDECEGMSEKLGMTVFQLKQWMDSTFFSHNDLQRTTDLGWPDFERLYTEVNEGNYENITDKERLHLNLKSFEIWDYPDYEEVVKKLRTALTSGKKGDLEKYEELTKLGFSVSKNYVSRFLDLISEEFYLD